MNGLEISHILKEAEKLKHGLFNNKEIFVVFDENGIILKKGSKTNACDVGKDNFKTLLRDYTFRKE